MKSTKLNNIYYAIIFTALGLIACILTASYTSLPVEVGEIISYAWSYLFFVAAFNIIGFSIIKFSNWIGVNLFRRWRMVLLYSCVAILLLVINYALLVTAKMIVGTVDPFIFPNGGNRVIVLVWLVELIVIGLLIANRSISQTLQIQQEAARLKEENNKARYTALQNQLNPHFLFNSLNTLISEIEYDPNNALLFTRNLSDAYRYVLQCQNKMLVTLREELVFMDSYIFLHKVRLGNYITVEKKIDQSLLDCRLPPLTLQLLVENVIKHNAITSSRPMVISIEISDGWLIIRNSVNAKKGMETTGTGLQNLSNRCLLMIGKDVSVVKEMELFTVKIPLSDE